MVRYGINVNQSGRLKRPERQDSTTGELVTPCDLHQPRFRWVRDHCGCPRHCDPEHEPPHPDTAECLGGCRTWRAVTGHQAPACTDMAAVAAAAGGNGHGWTPSG